MVLPSHGRSRCGHWASRKAERIGAAGATGSIEDLVSHRRYTSSREGDEGERIVAVDTEVVTVECRFSLTCSAKKDPSFLTGEFVSTEDLFFVASFVHVLMPKPLSAHHVPLLGTR